MATVKNNNTGFPSLYRATYENGWDLKNTGYNYGPDLLKNSMSSYMFRNRHLSKFLTDYLNPIMVFYINRVKYLRIYFNFAVPKWYKKIN